ncbi:MAG: 3-hydroxyacyl-ACP dehydratase FabZ [Chlamydiota bacterium]
MIDAPSAIAPKKIPQILPHRYPFLLVDKIVHLDLEKNIVIGQKNVSYSDPYFQGHFPEAPIMPGVLVVEAMAQTGGVLVHEKGHKDKLAVLLNIASAKFRKPVFPGSILMIHVEGIHISSNGGKIKSKAYIEGKVAVEAELSFALLETSAL